MADVKSKIEDMSPNETAAYEGDLMSAILRAAEFKKDESEYRRIHIKRQGKDVLSFIIRTLTEEDLSK